MDHIQLTVTFPKITPDNLDEFKRLAGEAVKIATDEPGLLQYDWFFNADETVCVVRERFENSDAVLIHLGNVGEILGPVVQLGGGLEIEMFGGSPSDQLMRGSKRSAPPITPTSKGSRRPSKGARMSVEENKAIIRRYIEVGWSTGDMSAVEEAIAPNYRRNQPNMVMPVESEKDLEQLIGIYRAGIPDLDIKIQHIVAEGD